jgi:hypothetical protein
MGAAEFWVLRLGCVAAGYILILQADTTNTKNPEEPLFFVIYKFKRIAARN